MAAYICINNNNQTRQIIHSKLSFSVQKYTTNTLVSEKITLHVLSRLVNIKKCLDVS